MTPWGKQKRSLVVLATTRTNNILQTLRRVFFFHFICAFSEFDVFLGLRDINNHPHAIKVRICGRKTYVFRLRMEIIGIITATHPLKGRNAVFN